MLTIKVALIGADNADTSLYRVLREIENVQIMGVMGHNLNAPGMIMAQREQLYVTANLSELVTNAELDVIIDLSGDALILQQIEQLKNEKTQLLTAPAESLLMAIIKSKVDEKKLKSELWVILNSMQEGVAIVDSQGVLKYLNPSFARMTGATSKQKVGSNIFEVSPHGALAQTLMLNKALTNFRTKIENVDVLANTAPIIVDGEVDGAVVVCQPITNLLKLLDDLRKSTTIIENLYDRINQITNAKFTFADLKGKSQLFSATIESAKKAAKSNLPVLLVGEGGTGKEVYAQAIHRASLRHHNSYLKVSTTAIAEGSLESELFGHEKGAFTGAGKTVLGKVEMVRGGTIYLEDIQGLNQNLQQKLVRLLREGEFQRLGSNDVQHADVRIIASTKENLQALVAQGLFAAELYALLKVFTIKLPPLRQRCEDISVLANHFISIYNRKFDKHVTEIDPEALQLLVNYDWPGNVLQLENIIERAMFLVESKTLKRQHLSPYISQFNEGKSTQVAKIIPLDEMEQTMLKAALARYGESLEGKKKAAQALNISLATLYNKLKKYKSSM